MLRKLIQQKIKFFIFLLTVHMVSFAKADEIIIYIRDDVYVDYLAFIDGKNIADINNFSGNAIRRDVVDMIIVQQALILGGFKHKFVYMPGKLNFRNTKMLQQGKLLLSFDSYWLADANELAKYIYISAPVIRKGEYVAGIYTSAQNKQVLAIDSLNDLTTLTAVSTPKWKTDWQTLQNLPLKQLIREDEWLSMARMVHLQWVDFLLMPFHSSKDLSFTMDKIHLIPVKGIAIELNDSRHFVISKNHPFGKAAFNAINRGLAKLRSTKAISRAYQQAGFFQDKSKLKIINRNK